MLYLPRTHVRGSDTRGRERAVEQLRRMRGSAPSEPMRCGDEACYLVKFPSNPQGHRTLASKLLGTRWVSRPGLLVPEAAIVEVGEEFIAHTEDVVMRLRCRRARERKNDQITDRGTYREIQPECCEFGPDALEKNARTIAAAAETGA